MTELKQDIAAIQRRSLVAARTGDWRQGARDEKNQRRCQVREESRRKRIADAVDQSSRAHGHQQNRTGRRLPRNRKVYVYELLIFDY